MNALKKIQALMEPVEDLQNRAVEVIKREVETLCAQMGYKEFHMHYLTYAITRTGKRVYDNKGVKHIHVLEDEFRSVFGRDTQHLIYRDGEWLD